MNVSGKRRLKPVLDSEWWLIGPTPPGLDAQLPGPAPVPSGLGADDAAARREHNAPVDHHIFRDDTGTFHLWGCIRATKVGRILYHWRTADIHTSPWECTGDIIRCNHDAGECLDDWAGDEWLQSPFFVRHGELWHMLYGGHGTGGTAADDCTYTTPSMPGQMCLMTSPDGLAWTRHCGAHGYSRVFAGPGEVRDPCVIRIGDLWYLYYAGFSHGEQSRPGFFCRTSTDLVHWSDYTLVHEDLAVSPHRWGTECPHVVERDGFYYLFRTEDYRKAITHVYRSDDPLDFGIGNAAEKHVCTFPGAAVEVYRMPDGSEVVSSNHEPDIGTHMARIRWVPDAAPVD